MTWIKICGTTNLEDALTSVDAGADALGFIFAEGPRRVTAEQARDIIAKMPREIEKIGVFVEHSVEEIRSVAEAAQLTGIQLHQEATLKRHQDIYQSARALGLRLIQVIRLPEFPDADESTYLQVAHGMEPDAYLLDRRVDQASGGTGRTFDWTQWRDEFRFHNKSFPRLIIAGGLAPGNVAGPLRIFSPYGVDVVSGVEREKGKKDPAKLRAFVKAVRDADAQAKR